MFPIFFVINIYFFVKNITFYKILRYLLIKRNNMKNTILFILIILCIAQVCLIKAQQDKITDLERTLSVKEQVISNISEKNDDRI